MREPGTESVKKDLTTNELIQHAQKRQKSSASQIRKKVGESSTSGILEALGGSTGPDAFSSVHGEINLEENPMADELGEQSVKESVKQSVKEANVEVVMEPSEVQSRTSYVSNLEKNIDEERLKRQALESQIEELKKINSEISSKLGLSKEELLNR